MMFSLSDVTSNKSIEINSSRAAGWLRSRLYRCQMRGLDVPGFMKGKEDAGGHIEVVTAVQ